MIIVYLNKTNVKAVIINISRQYLIFVSLNKFVSFVTEWEEMNEIFCKKVIKNVFMRNESNRLLLLKFQGHMLEFIVVFLTLLRSN